MHKTLISLSFCAFASTAQQVVSTAGDSYKTRSATISWTIGEVATETYTTPSGTATQGMQQPTLSIVTHSNTKSLDVTAIVFPNPTSNSIQLSFQEQKLHHMTYSVCNLNGVELLKGGLENAESVIDLSMLPTATYFLKISKEGKDQKTFKIIKQ